MPCRTAADILICRDAELVSSSFQGSIEALSLFGLGRQTTLNLSDSMGGLRFLELQRSNRLAYIDVVAGLRRLECLALDNLPALTGLPDFSALRQLSRLEIIGCKRLTDLGPSGQLPRSARSC